MDPRNYNYTISTNKPFKPSVVEDLAWAKEQWLGEDTVITLMSPILLAIGSDFNIERFLVDILQRQFVHFKWEMEVEQYDLYESEEYSIFGHKILESHLIPIPQIITEWSIRDETLQEGAKKSKPNTGLLGIRE